MNTSSAAPIAPKTSWIGSALFTLPATFEKVLVAWSAAVEYEVVIFRCR